MATEKILRSLDDLIAAGIVSSDARLMKVAEKHAIGITPTMARLINVDDPHDPIARQFVPSTVETVALAEERLDPIGDLNNSPIPGIVHRYPDRVLLKAVHVCPVYCRFCFRREMVGPQGLGMLSELELETAFDYIAAHKEIWEVILTGGDPLVLSARRLLALMERLGKIAHVKIVRFHTRVPMVQPERIDAAMVAALKASGKVTYLAIHANHPREFTSESQVAMTRLNDGGITLVSQTVLLRGVNDSVETLVQLMRMFVENRVKPYYLHHPDLTPGTSHFRLGIAQGQALVAALRGRISGLCQPVYVLDIPGGHGKADIGMCSLTEEDGTIIIQDWKGMTHRYPPDA